jgi:hypothetical protein
LQLFKSLKDEPVDKAGMRVFLDESGTHRGSRVTAVAGYLISADSLPLLEDEWMRLLAEHGLSELHMKEFVPPNGKYSHWDHAKKRALLEPLIRLIHKYCVLGVGAAVEMDEFMQTTHARANAKAPNLVESPYEACLRHCMWQIATWADENEYKGVIAYTLDRGDPNSRGARRKFNAAKEDQKIRAQYHLGTLEFADSQAVPAIQCADLLAYEMYKEADRLLSGSQRSLRKSFSALWRENDQLVTIDPIAMKRQVTHGMNLISAVRSLLPPRERFQVTCYSLRSLSEEKRETLFGMIPELRNVYKACIASGEMGKRLDQLPPEIMPSDDAVLRRIEQRKVSPMQSDDVSIPFVEVDDNGEYRFLKSLD